MTETTTFNDLLLFAFNETQPEQTVKVVQALDNETGVKEYYSDLLSLLSMLRTEDQIEPAEFSVKFILAKA